MTNEQYGVNREQILENAGYSLDRLLPEGRLVDAVVIDGSLIYASGQVPYDGETLTSIGKVPSDVTREAAEAAAALCAANILRVVRNRIGSLDAIDRIVRITGYVNSDQRFADHHLVVKWRLTVNFQCIWGCWSSCKDGNWRGWIASRSFHGS